ncbi:MAG TPA: hypothetical protein DCG30_07735 [Ruminococcus sp.]|nr:hypothetical protein [Ruminococcus sp.]
MEHLQKSEIKILLIVEGENTEYKFFHRITEVFGINAQIFSVSTNLYSLYHKMKNYDFQCDVKDVLREIVPSEEKKNMLKQKFTYTYLIFDSDLQNKAPSQREKETDISNLTDENFSKLKKMAEYFTDETDPSIGRLYINYPMMESYRYCDKFFDESFLTAQIELDKMAKFKSLASKKKLAGLQIERYEKQDFSDLIRMNVLKLNVLSEESAHFSTPYNKYLDKSQQKLIAIKQQELAQHSKVINILNTSLFVVLDYYGNRDSFYDKLIQ